MPSWPTWRCLLLRAVRQAPRGRQVVRSRRTGNRSVQGRHAVALYGSLPGRIVPGWSSPSMTLVPAGQRNLHVASEAAALAVAVPFLGYVATRKELPGWVRAGSGALAVATLAIDGYLLVQWARKG